MALVLGFTGCGKSDDKQTYGGIDAAHYKEMLQNTLTSVEAMDENTINQYVAQASTQGDSVTAEFFENYQECYPLKGDFKEFYDEDDTIGGVNLGPVNIGGTKGFSVAKSGKTITATILADYSKRDLKLTFVFNANDVTSGPTAINIEPVYSLGETMQKAGLNTVMGILIVFAMLVVMSGVIKCFEIIPKLEKRAKDKTDVVEPVAVETPTTTVKNETDDLQLVAVIAAAIAASTGASTDSFVVRSIKKRF